MRHQKKIVYEKFSQEDLIHIWEYIAPDVPERADEFIRKMVHHINNLSFFPELGIEIENIEKEYRVLSYKSYNIFYRLKKNVIYIERILHQSRNIKELL